jgi:translin
MINKQEFKQIKKELENFDKKREELILLSREIIKLSKQCIYSIHRNEIKSAEKFLSQMQKKIPTIKQKKTLETNMGNVAIQEYVEAYAYLYFIKNKELITKKECDCDNENYLLGICDLTGELMRKAVNETINQNYELVFKIHKLTSEIYHQFLEFNLRNSELRKKSDSIKWNLTKIEDLVLKIKLRE